MYPTTLKTESKTINHQCCNEFFFSATRLWRIPQTIHISSKFSGLKMSKFVHSLQVKARLKGWRRWDSIVNIHIHERILYTLIKLNWAVWEKELVSVGPMSLCELSGRNAVSTSRSYVMQHTACPCSWLSIILSFFFRYIVVMHASIFYLPLSPLQTDRHPLCRLLIVCVG